MSKYKFSDIAINSTLKKKPVESDKDFYIGLEHLDSQCLHVTRYGSDVAPIGEKLVMKKGDILFGKRRAYQKKVAIAPFEGIFSAHGMVLRPNEKVIDKDYFPFFISSDYFLDAAIKISVGSLSPTINWSDLKELEFDLPSIEEQKKLAKILWAAEDLKLNYDTIQKNVTKTEKIIFSRFIEEIKNGKGFIVKRIDEIVNKLIKSKLPASMGKDEGDYPFFLSGRGEKRINEALVDGEVLLCNDGGNAMFRYYNGKCAYSDHVFGLSIKDKNVKIKYLFYFLNYNREYIDNNLFKGTGLKNIDKKEFFKYNVIIPSLFEQEKIINLMDKINCHKKLILGQLELINQIQKSIMNGGQVDVQ